MDNIDEIDDNLGKQLIYYHKNPLIKIDLPSKKYIRSNSNEEVEKYQNILKEALERPRVERRCARTQAEWLPEQQLAKVTKVVKSLLKSHGFQDKTGIYLYPEEMLYLLESNRLELKLNGIPLSIEEAYEFVGQRNNTYKMNLKIYLVYKKLCTLGYKLMRYDHYVKQKEKKSLASSSGSTNPSVSEDINTEPIIKRRKMDHTENSKTNTNEDTHQDSTEASSLSKEQTIINNIFSKMQIMAPKEYSPESSTLENPDYYVFLPNHLRSSTPDFRLFICESKLMDRMDFGKNQSDIFAICNEDDVAFYKICEGHLPII